MAKILFAAGIEEVSGALSKVNTKSKHRYDQNMFLATHRKAATMSLACQRAYYRKINSLPWQQTTTAPSSETLAIREAFAIAVRAISTRKENLTMKAQDLAAFKTWREAQPGRLNNTLNKFYWLAAKKYKNGETGAIDWPSGPIDLDS